jgi:hypothetical protein
VGEGVAVAVGAAGPTTAGRNTLFSDSVAVAALCTGLVTVTVTVAVAALFTDLVTVAVGVREEMGVGVEVGCPRHAVRKTHSSATPSQDRRFRGRGRRDQTRPAEDRFGRPGFLLVG